MKISARVAYFVKRAKQLFKDAVPTPASLMKIFKEKKVGITKPQADQVVDKLKIDNYDKLVKLGNQVKNIAPTVQAKSQTVVEQPKPVSVGEAPPKRSSSYGYNR